MAGRGVDQSGSGCGNGGTAPASSPLLGECLQVRQGGVALGVHDGVHVLGPAHDAKLGYRLVGCHHKLQARALGFTNRVPVVGSEAPPGP